MAQYHTNSEAETQALGEEIAKNLTGGDILLLYGDLGAGKTAFSKGIARGLGVLNDVVSPTFTIMQTYPVPEIKKPITTLVHIDTYRLETAEDLLTIGAEEYIGAPNTISLIEWPEKILTLLENHPTGDQPKADKKTISIIFEQINNTERSISITSSD